MGFQSAFPYATDNRALSCTVVPNTPEVRQRVDGTWDAFSDDPGKFKLAMKVEANIGLLAACLREGEVVEDTLELVVLLQGLHARERSEVARLDVGNHELTVELDPDQYMGRVDLTCVARLRSGAYKPQVGHPHLKASKVAVAEAASIWFTEPPESSGDSLDIRWVDFRDDGALVDEHLFALRLSQRPEILLNSAIPSAYDILSSRGTHGAAARIRDAVYAQIVHQVWSSILSHCLIEIVRYDEADQAATVLAELDDWQAQVIRAWAPAFVPSESEPEAAAEALIDKVRESGSVVLIETLPEVIQSRCATISGFNGLIAEFDRFQGSQA